MLVSLDIEREGVFHGYRTVKLDSCNNLWPHCVLVCWVVNKEDDRTLSSFSSISSVTYSSFVVLRRARRTEAYWSILKQIIFTCNNNYRAYNNVKHNISLSVVRLYNIYYMCLSWRPIGRFDAFRPKGRGFESLYKVYSRHVGTSGQVLHSQLHVAFRLETPTQYPCWVGSVSE